MCGIVSEELFAFGSRGDIITDVHLVVLLGVEANRASLVLLEFPGDGVFPLSWQSLD